MNDEGNIIIDIDEYVDEIKQSKPKSAHYYFLFDRAFPRHLNLQLKYG